MPTSWLGRPPRYHSYLLRCWSDVPGRWRFSVEDPHTGARRGFLTMAALVAFLDATLGAEGEAEGASDATPSDVSRPCPGPPLAGRGWPRAPLTIHLRSHLR